MIEQGLFKRYFVGRDNFVWWLGQVVDKTKWEGNIPGYRTPTTGGHEGFDQRYKVRIMGYHTGDKIKLTDDDLPWASIMLPVTSGAGTGGSSQTPNLRQGNFVYGFFLDGEDAQQPIIMGVIGYNDYTQILNDLPEAGFKPFEGYDREKEIVARFSLRTSKETPAAVQSGGPSLQETDPLNTQATGNINNSKIQSTTGPHSLTDGASAEQKYEGEKTKNLKKPSSCGEAKGSQPLGEILDAIKTTIQDVERIRKTVYDWETKVSTKVDNVQRKIEEKIKYLADFISQKMTIIINEIENKVIQAVNDLSKPLYNLLHPVERNDLKTTMDKVNDIIACLFRKLIDGLYGFISNLINKIFDKAVNVPTCLVENYGSIIIGSILDEIFAMIELVLDLINKIIPVGDAIGEILAFLANVFSFLTCDTNPECAKIDEYSPWGGPGKLDVPNVQKMFSDAKKVIGVNVASVIPSASSIGNMTLDSSLGSCAGLGPEFCGPPGAQFFGGEGLGAAGNPVVSITGEIMGVDMASGGSGYSGSPFVKFKDNCGTGSGAVGKAIMVYSPNVGNPFNNVSAGNGSNSRPIGGDNGQQGCVPLSGITNSATSGSNMKNGSVIAVVMSDFGKDYLPAGDGSTGGQGRTYGKYCQTIVRRANGCYDLPYSSGQQITLNAGDYIQYPGRAETKAEVTGVIVAPKCGDYDSSGSQPLPPFPERRFTGNTPPVFDPNLNENILEEIPPIQEEVTYEVIPTIDEIVILDSGFEYEVGDDVFADDKKIGEVSVVDNNGSAIGIILEDRVTTYSKPPVMIIKSRQGFNARITPLFKFRQVTEDIDVEELGLNVVTVVDCVGKIPPKQNFDRVPR